MSDVHAHRSYHYKKKRRLNLRFKCFHNGKILIVKMIANPASCFRYVKVCSSFARNIIFCVGKSKNNAVTDKESKNFSYFCDKIKQFQYGRYYNRKKC